MFLKTKFLHSWTSIVKFVNDLKWWKFYRQRKVTKFKKHFIKSLFMHLAMFERLCERTSENERQLLINAIFLIKLAVPFRKPNGSHEGRCCMRVGAAWGSVLHEGRCRSLTITGLELTKHYSSLCVYKTYFLSFFYFEQTNIKIPIFENLLMRPLPSLTLDLLLILNGHPNKLWNDVSVSFQSVGRRPEKTSTEQKRRNKTVEDSNLKN